MKKKYPLFDENGKKINYGKKKMKKIYIAGPDVFEKKLNRNWKKNMLNFVKNMVLLVYIL